jgi:protein-L-isoaspartate(D-aspartate) O-methyltransferase
VEAGSRSGLAGHRAGAALIGLPMDLVDVRRRYAEEVCRRARVTSPAILRAFATVARERYLGAGPWPIWDPSALAESGSMYRLTPDADPVHVYRDVLIGIEPARMLNNGQPSGHALWIDALDPRPGDRLVHIGCGTGYYTAVMTEIVGPTGAVTAVELDPELAARARANLSPYASVTVVQADGTAFDFDPADAVYVNAGATHPLGLWVDRLAPNGRMTVPLVRWPTRQAERDAAGCGVFMKFTRSADADVARIVSLVQIFPCLGAVDAEADRRLAEAFGRGVDAGRQYVLRRDRHAQAAECWLHGDGYCLTLT